MLSRSLLLVLLLSVPCLAAAAVPTTAPAQAPTTVPTTLPAVPPVTTVVNTLPVNIPFKLTDTNHLLVRLKINGKGPFNFIVDTGCPTMVLRVPVAKELGLKTDARGITYLDRMQVEGGADMGHVMCLVETPYQIEGMNAIGASGIDLDGLLGYTVLAKFKLQIDMTKDHMVWTPSNYRPAIMMRRDRGATTRPTARPTTRPARTGRSGRSASAARDSRDTDEDRLESTGGLLKVLGPMMKPAPTITRDRGFIGMQLSTDANGVAVAGVMGDSPAANAGAATGDRILAINDRPVKSITDVRAAMAGVLSGQMVRFTLHRGDDPLNLYLSMIACDGF